MESTTQLQEYKQKQSSSLQLLEIIPGTIYYEQFANSGMDSNDELVDGQVRFRPSADKGWLQDINVPNPVSVDWDGEVMTNVEKNAKGDVFLEYVGKKRKISVKWNFLTQVEYNDLLTHLKVDFRSRYQNYLYYKITTLNPNGDKATRDIIQNNKPQLDSFISYLDGKYSGQVKMYHQGDELLIGYSDLSLIFMER